MIGHTDRLEAEKAVDHWKSRGLDFSHLFYQPEVGDYVGRYKQMEQDHGLEGALDNTTLLALCAPALESAAKRSKRPCRSRTSTALSAPSSAAS